MYLLSNVYMYPARSSALGDILAYTLPRWLAGRLSKPASYVVSIPTPFLYPPVLGEWGGHKHTSAKPRNGGMGQKSQSYFVIKHEIF